MAHLRIVVMSHDARVQASGVVRDMLPSELSC